MAVCGFLHNFPLNFHWKVAENLWMKSCSIHLMSSLRDDIKLIQKCHCKSHTEISWNSTQAMHKFNIQKWRKVNICSLTPGFIMFSKCTLIPKCHKLWIQIHWVHIHAKKPFDSHIFPHIRYSVQPGILSLTCYEIHVV